MWDEILKTALSNGLWAVLFCVLLMYQLRDGRTREHKYRETINALLDRLETLESVEKGVNEAVSILRRQESEPRKKAKSCSAGTEVLRV